MSRQLHRLVPPVQPGSDCLLDTVFAPRSAFFVFCSEYRPSVKQQYPGLSIGDCAKKLGEMWSKLSQSEKQPYEEKAQKLREKYDRVRLCCHKIKLAAYTVSGVIT